MITSDFNEQSENVFQTLDRSDNFLVSLGLNRINELDDILELINVNIVNQTLYNELKNTFSIAIEDEDELSNSNINLLDSGFSYYFDGDSDFRNQLFENYNKLIDEEPVLREDSNQIDNALKDFVVDYSVDTHVVNELRSNFNKTISEDRKGPRKKIIPLRNVFFIALAAACLIPIVIIFIPRISIFENGESIVEKSIDNSRIISQPSDTSINKNNPVINDPQTSTPIAPLNETITKQINNKVKGSDSTLPNVIKNYRDIIQTRPSKQLITQEIDYFDKQKKDLIATLPEDTVFESLRLLSNRALNSISYSEIKDLERSDQTDMDKFPATVFSKYAEIIKSIEKSDSIALDEINKTLDTYAMLSIVNVEVRNTIESMVRLGYWLTYQFYGFDKSKNYLSARKKYSQISEVEYANLISEGYFNFRRENPVTIYFDYNKFTLRPDAFHYLNSVLEKDSLIKNNFTLLIKSYYACRGEDKDNLRLTELRSIAVKNYLMSMGFKKSAIHILPYQISIDQNFDCLCKTCSEEDLQKQRKTIIYFLPKENKF